MMYIVVFDTWMELHLYSERMPINRVRLFDSSIVQVDHTVDTKFVNISMKGTKRYPLPIDVTLHHTTNTSQYELVF